MPHCRPLSARSSKCRRPFPRSRSAASGPMSWPVRASRSISSRGRSRSSGWSCWPVPTRTMQISWLAAGKAPISGLWAAIWRWQWALSDTCRPCVGRSPGRFAKRDRLSKLEALGHIPPLLGPWLPLRPALDDIPALALTEAQADRGCRQGQPVFLTRDAPPSMQRAGSRRMRSKLVALVRSGRPRPSSRCASSTFSFRKESDARLRRTAQGGADQERMHKIRRRHRTSPESAGRDPRRTHHQPHRALQGPTRRIIVAPPSSRWSASNAVFSTISRTATPSLRQADRASGSASPEEFQASPFGEAFSSSRRVPVEFGLTTRLLSNREGRGMFEVAWPGPQTQGRRRAVTP